MQVKNQVPPILSLAIFHWTPWDYGRKSSDEMMCLKWHEPCRTELEPFRVQLRDVGSSSNPQRFRSKHQPGLRKVTQNRQKNSVNLTLFIIWMDKSIWSCIYCLHISALMNQQGFKDICSRFSSTASCWKKHGQLLLWSKVIIGPT